ncbi:unnamed protein product [Rangifer tarandus platyrhynchus]|uniref:Uncharacterized protein n=2 Tax=Rangifer tarandus platyrhynchus TaxID=3082113 RepID=A0ABN9A2M6_RANTA|nr:unnamed protein product [Rangifer tarandus platyrhynchus]CAI9713751.1 unnamed protein product [Rangifer tarandus platyrhynchus]
MVGLQSRSLNYCEWVVSGLLPASGSGAACGVSEALEAPAGKGKGPKSKDPRSWLEKRDGEESTEPGFPWDHGSDGRKAGKLPPACTEKLLRRIPESRRVWKERGKEEVLRGFRRPLSPRGAPTALPDSTQAGERGVRSHPKRALLWRLPEGCASLAAPRVTSPRGEGGPSAPVQSQLTGVPRRELDGARTARATGAWFAFPWLRTCPGLPARRADPAAEPGPGACASSGPAPALSRAPSLPGTLGQTWGGLSRAIGLGRCSDPALRIPPGFGGPLCGPATEGPGQRLTFDPTHHSRIPQVPLHPSPGAQGFETVVTPQRKRHIWDCALTNSDQLLINTLTRRWSSRPASPSKYVYEPRAARCQRGIACVPGRERGHSAIVGSLPVNVFSSPIGV